MADDKMTAQMGGKSGFIAALDQSGGSTPETLRLYGIQDSAFSGEVEMYRLIHEMRLRITSAAAFTGEGDRNHPIRAHDGWRGQGPSGASLSMGDARRRAVRQN